jgi:hypothetical protein
MIWDAEKNAREDRASARKTTGGHALCKILDRVADAPVRSGPASSLPLIRIECEERSKV